MVQCGWGAYTVRVRCGTDTVRYVNVLLLSTVVKQKSPYIVDSVHVPKHRNF